MTSTPDAAEHPEVSELSDLTEDLLSPSRAVDVRHHLDGCALCADVHGSLEEIRGLLGTLPGPPRMPADISGRIDAALAAEALLNATAPGATAPEATRTAQGTAPRVSRETQAAPPRAASGSASSSSDGAPSRPTGHPRAAHGPGRQRPGPRRHRRTVATAALSAVATVAVIGLGALLLQPGGRDTRQDVGAQASGQAESAAGKESFSGNDLGDQVAALLAQGRGLDMDSAPSTASGFSTESGGRSPNSPMRESGPEVPECVQRGIGRADTPLAAERGTYEGTKAYLVVLTHVSDASHVSAYVVDASCANQGSTSKGEVLLNRSYPRR
ncbi:hypothetical protein [Streptomyces apocyni]|uniref:hypothetical protein n=1 Tax=Streptomyces apocyni TaxID=2654677 RepID=UPI0012EA6C93|nr:hypothetical protein [Streptomyces apocyni]